MFAEHGVGVSLRQISAQAGYRNPSTVQYHFGTRAGLVQAILEQRLPVVDSRRAELLRHCDNGELRSLIDAMVRPLFEINQTSRYIDFWVRLAGHPELSAGLRALGHLSVTAMELQKRISAHLENIPEEVRWIRLHFAMDTTFSAIANRSRSKREGGTRLAPENDEVFLQLLYDAVIGLLLAEHTA
jgi:AcrR family transcriptional regulator